MAQPKHSSSSNESQRETASRSRPQSEPIVLSATWQMQSTGEASMILAGETDGYAYRRDGHPNASNLIDTLRSMHQAEDVVLTAQGMSSLAAPCFAFLRPGDSVALGQPLYGKTTVLTEGVMSEWGIKTIHVDACDAEDWKRTLALKPKMVIIETITNPRMSVPDIAWISSHCKAVGAKLLVDNTFATSVLCRPLSLGADLVMESLTKFVSGHGDAMLGMVAGSRQLCDPIRKIVSTFGMSSSPLDCWLTHRGIATLRVRHQQACQSAMAIAQSIVDHPAVEKVDYPGLASHPQHAIAKNQFGDRFGNMLSIHLAGTTFRADDFIRILSPAIPFCPSLGEAQTTLSHPTSTSHRGCTLEQLNQYGITRNTIRVSVGIEETSELVAQFQSGLDQLR